LWQQCQFGGSELRSIHVTSWPTFSEDLTIDNEIELVFQVNGKLVSKALTKRGITKDEAEKLALADGKIQAKIAGQTVRKVIVVPDKLVNVVI
jgi:leucyl-tRNA synthetase